MKNRANSKKPLRDTLNLRIPAAERNLIDRAALSVGKTRTKFVLEAARHAAEDVLSDRRHFGLNAQQWQAFMAALDAPARSHPRLQRLLNEPSLFDKNSPVTE